jgi:hypothetical protein
MRLTVDGNLESQRDRFEMKISFRMSVATVLAVLTTTAAIAQERPNILVIWGDDVG